jgi:hypothetical protein
MRLYLGTRLGRHIFAGASFRPRHLAHLIGWAVIIALVVLFWR